MSIETDFRQLLLDHPPLEALVATRVAQDAVAPGAGWPAVVFSCSHNPEHGLDGTVFADICTLSVQCWATTPQEAGAVADAVAQAIRGVQGRDITLLDRSTTFDSDLGVDGVVLGVEWIV